MAVFLEVVRSGVVLPGSVCRVPPMLRLICHAGTLYLQGPARPEYASRGPVPPKHIRKCSSNYAAAAACTSHGAPEMHRVPAKQHPAGEEKEAR